ncbi:transglycosylase SLT domain-containing protein [Pseudoroseomonas sp. WGS1072]|uniref:transglycosylase SLT domain-containing protein n=1 Tax=Roseomonas sp. WGS1072 TaxID=3366816 RepID=UPI003BF2C896
MFLVVLLVSALFAGGREARCLELHGTIWEEAANRAGVADPLLLYAISLVEAGRSAGSGRIAPWPWTVRTPNGPVFAESREAAELLLRTLPRDSNSDIGLMQVNLRHNGHLAASVEDLLDPASNLRIAASILRRAMDSIPLDPVLGVGRYHSWTEWRAREYGTLVWATYYGLAGLRHLARRGGE